MDGKGKKGEWESEGWGVSGREGGEWGDERTRRKGMTEGESTCKIYAPLCITGGCNCRSGGRCGWLGGSGGREPRTAAGAEWLEF